MGKNKKVKGYPTRSIGVIHSQGGGIYTRPDGGKRHNRKTCVYYEKVTQRCTNTKCSRAYCYSGTCGAYKRREKPDQKKEIQDGLSSYDENYIHTPGQAGIHERTNEYIQVSKNIGTPCHVGYMKKPEREKRRHKSRCINYISNGKECRILNSRCTGSSHCNNYEEHAAGSE